MCKFVAVNRVGKPCALVAHARFEMGAVDLEFLRSAAYLIIDEGSSMKYILNERYILRGWQRLPYGVMNNGTKEVQFVKKEFFDFLLKCDGRMEIPEIQNPELKKYVGKHLEDGVIRPARRTDFLSTEQLFVQYPCRYKHDVQWSVTGRCNLLCKHYFMSAPTGKHGNPSYEELLNVADQLAECGVFSVGLPAENRL